MDGTLIDTEPYWISAEIELVARHGGTWSHDDGLSLIGLPLLKSAAILQDRGGVQVSREEIVTALLTRVAQQMIDKGIPWRPGALALLDQLREAQIPSALVTMSYPLLTDVMVSALPEGTFSAVITGDIVTHGKPHPEPYLTAAAELGVDIATAVAVEDSPAGVASAEAAGARVIAVPHFVEIPARLGRSRVRSLEDLNVAVLAMISRGETVDLLLA